MKVLVGVDPPHGVGVWGESGPVALIQSRKQLARECRADSYRQLCEALDGHEVVGAGVEYAYGLQDIGRNSSPEQMRRGLERVQSLISQADSGGVWEGWLSERYPDATVWRWRASEWRSRLGMGRLRQEDAKSYAEKLVAKAYAETGGVMPLGGRGSVLGHACEGMCIALALQRARRVLPAGAAERWWGTGSFREVANAGK